MKPSILTFITIAVFGILPGLSKAEDSSPVGMLPDDRTSITLESKERNPFAKQEIKEEMPAPGEEKESEESRIRRVLGKLTVVGRTKGANGWKVLLGDLILEKDRTLPPVIEGQTQVLRVANVYDGSVELIWEDKSGSGEPRKMFIPIDLSPRVHTALAGKSTSITAPHGNAPNPPQDATPQ
jgi:hypothetical protein